MPREHIVGHTAPRSPARGEPIAALERVVLTRCCFENHLIAPFEFDCADYEIKSASIGCGHGAAVFRCTISPVGTDVLAALESVARSGEMIRLVFPKRPLLIERIEVERAEPGSVRIIGRVVEH